MTARTLLALPIEVRHCILSHLAARARPTPAPAPVSTRPPPRRRFAAFARPLPLAPAPAPASLSPSASSLPDLASSASGVDAIFEAPDAPEYASVPASTLDRAASSVGAIRARSPDESLLAVLRTKDYALAHALLDQLAHSATQIPRRYLFGLYAAKLVLTRPAEWLEWWKLTPRLVPRDDQFGGVHDDVANLKRADKAHVERARKVARKLHLALSSAQEEDAASDDGDGGRAAVDRAVATMVEFGRVLAIQGQARVVAEDLVCEVALADGQSVDAGLDLWAFAVAELVAQAPRFVAEGAYLARVDPEVERVEQATLGPAERTARERTRVAERTKEMERWFQSRTFEAYKALVRSRERVIKALANSDSRLDDAVDVLVATRDAPSLARAGTGTGNESGGGVKLSKTLYLTLLAQTSRQDRFDLFDRVYRELHRDARKLVRIDRPELRGWSPYFARGVRYGGGGAGFVSAQEAFVTFRDQHAVSLIEEGSGSGSDSRTSEYSALTGTDVDHYGRSTSRVESDRLVHLAVEADRLDLALERLTTLLSRGPLPSCASVATVIACVARHPNGAATLATIDDLVAGSYWRRGFWTTCRMLADLDAQELASAVARFRDSFRLTGLPAPLVAAIKGTTLRMVPTRDHRRDQSVANAYTVAVLMQALVPLLATSHRTSGGSQHVSRILEAMLDDPSRRRFEIVPSHHRARPTTRPRSPLDPYTFTPFLVLILERSLVPPSSSSSSSSRPRDPRRRRRDDDDDNADVRAHLLDVLSSMHALGVRPETPHLSLLLSSYASSSSLTEFEYLLASIEHDRAPPPPGPPARSVSPNLVEFVHRHFSPSEEEGERAPPARGDDEDDSRRSVPPPAPAGSRPAPPNHPPRSPSSSSSSSLSPRFYASVLKSLRLGGGNRRRHPTTKDDDEAQRRDVAVRVLARWIDHVGGLDQVRPILLSSSSVGGDALRVEIAHLGLGLGIGATGTGTEQQQQQQDRTRGWSS
ncbi:hypothetical protein JCM11491_003899 [Sporobolomyces phaffii]